MFPDTPLDPNELDSFLKLLKVVADDSRLLSPHVLVPNDDAVLVPISRCYFNDAPWLLDRIQRDHIHMVNSKLSFPACEKLKIQRLSSVIKEELHKKFKPEIIRQEDEISSLLNSQEFARGVCAIVHQLRAYWSTDFDYLNSLNEQIIRSLLSGYQVVFIKTLQTSFQFVPKKRDVTLKSEGTLAFVHEKNKIIYVSKVE